MNLLAVVRTIGALYLQYTNEIYHASYDELGHSVLSRPPYGIVHESAKGYSTGRRRSIRVQRGSRNPPNDTKPVTAEYFGGGGQNWASRRECGRQPTDDATSVYCLARVFHAMVALL